MNMQTVWSVMAGGALAATAAPLELHIALDTHHAARVSAVLAPQQQCALERSDDMTNWAVVALLAHTHDADAPVQYVDTACQARAFYRLRETNAANVAFIWNGTNFTYTDSQRTVSGILLKPAGSGPFPAVLISHGLGGSAQGFALPKAREMVAWGMVCIGPNYTHITNVPADYAGDSPENIARARACLDVLAQQPFVDAAWLCAYGNSMGAFVTIGAAGRMTNRIAVAAITAGGVSDTANEAFAVPTTNTAHAVRAPFLMLHGETDTTVPPVYSARLQQILASNGVPNLRVTYPGIGHNLHTALSTDVYNSIEHWFRTNGVPLAL